LLVSNLSPLGHIRFFGSAAGKLGHAPIEAPAEELGNHACRLSLFARAGGALFKGMETTVGRVLAFLMSVVAAAVTALSLAYIAHYDFGLSRQEIRTPAVVGAVVIAALVTIEFFGKKLAKPK
jgi:hypothetical protein